MPTALVVVLPLTARAAVPVKYSRRSPGHVWPWNWLARRMEAVLTVTVLLKMPLFVLPLALSAPPARVIGLKIWLVPLSARSPPEPVELTVIAPPLKPVVVPKPRPAWLTSSIFPFTTTLPVNPTLGAPIGDRAAALCEGAAAGEEPNIRGCYIQLSVRSVCGRGQDQRSARSSNV